jgi:hypothetical protein
LQCICELSKQIPRRDWTHDLALLYVTAREGKFHETFSLQSLPVKACFYNILPPSWADSVWAGTSQSVVILTPLSQFFSFFLSLFFVILSFSLYFILFPFFLSPSYCV